MDDKISYAEKTFKPTQEDKSHIQNLKGAGAIMWSLWAIIEQQNHIIRKSCMSFFDAFSLFLSCHELESVRILSHQSRKKEFKEFLCHPKHGLVNSRVKVSDDCKSTKESVIQL